MPTSTPPSDASISSTLQETRRFAPRPAADLGFPRWHVPTMEAYHALHQQSVHNPAVFWDNEARNVSWFHRWDEVLEWHAPDAKWFTGGKLNACWNCVDRHVQAGHGEQTALIWEGEPVAPRTSHAAPGSSYAAEPEVRLPLKAARSQAVMSPGRGTGR